MKRKKTIMWIVVFIISLVIMYQYELLFRQIGINKKPDISFGYSANELHKFFERLLNGYQEQFVIYLLLDCIFIIAFLKIQNEILRRVIQLQVKPERYQWTLWIARVRGGMDLFENLMFLLLTRNIISSFTVGCRIASTFTQIKFIALGLWILSVCILLMVGIISKRKDR